MSEITSRRAKHRWAALAAAALALSPGRAALAANATVNSTADTNPPVCDTANTNNPCTLRGALAQAANGNVIGFSALFNTPQTINLESALPHITVSVTIIGPGANLLTVQRDPNAATQFRVFTIDAGISSGVLLQGMTIAGGNIGDIGGGIYSQSPLTLLLILVTGNTGATGGGGVYLLNADGTFANCTFSANRATGAGAAGGAIYFEGDGTHTLRVVNSTISGNTSVASGGGIENESAGGTSTLQVTSSTIVNNSAALGGGIDTFAAGDNATTTLANTIIANNTAGNLTTETAGGTPTVTSSGFNLASDDGGNFLSQSSDQTNVDPLLGPLSLNGGTTPTHALLGGSPALDKGNKFSNTADQRGAPRPFGSAQVSGGDGSDIGAVEMHPLFVTNTNDDKNVTNDGSLRAAITAANGSGSNFNDIIFDNTVFKTSQTITLETALPDIGNNVTISGPGANLLTVQRDPNASAFRIFNIPNVGLNVTFSGMTISGGNGDGGGIESFSNLTLTSIHVTGNVASVGGAVYLQSADGSFTNCTFSNNSATGYAGALLFEGDGNHTLRVVNCTISGNRSASTGGGIENDSLSGDSSRLEVVNSTITNNSAGTGGGIFTYTQGAGSTATTTLRNTINAANTPDNLATGTVDGDATAVTSLGFNLTSDDGGGFLTQSSDKKNVDARLGPLSLNGGTTPTHALLGGSLALDNGNSSGATFDQRAAPRIFDISAIDNNATGSDGSDIGAMEMHAIIVSNTNDDKNVTNDGSLRAAITTANGSGSNFNDIIFDNTVFSTPQTITLEDALPDITSSLTMTGPAANLLTVQRDPNATSQFRVFYVGGGISNGVTLAGLTISGGNSSFGGGIYSISNTALTNVHVTGNTADSAGGVGLGGVDAVLTNCTVSGNRVAQDYAGVLFAGSGGHRLRLLNCTISGNIAGSVDGSLSNISFQGSSTMEVINSTIVNNIAGGAAGIDTYSQGDASTTATTTIRNSIIAGNIPDNLASGSGGGAITVTTLGFNLSNDFNSVITPLATDIVTATPRLGPLSRNGGQTPTHALLEGSLAINHGDPSGFTMDQRGVRRPSAANPNPDIGAVEMNYFTVLNPSDHDAGSLRSVIDAANSSGPGIADIVFLNGVFSTSHTITLETALPDITTSVTINGPGANLLTVQRASNAATAFRIFNIPNTGMNIAMSGMTIAGGNTGGYGGGISCSSNLALSAVHVTGNMALGGAGVFLDYADGDFSNSTFSNNSAMTQGGGGGIAYQGEGNHTLRLTGCTISGNQALSGGGVWNVSANDGGRDSRLEVINSTIANNSAAGEGGGIFTYTEGPGTSTTTTIRNSIIAANTSNNLATRDERFAGRATTTSLGFNLSSDDGGGSLTQPTDKINAFAGLAPLADNSGPTPTHALYSTSAALDAGNNSYLNFPTDQRGFPRTVNLPGTANANGSDGTDIGAFEAQSAPATPTIAINNVSQSEGNSGTTSFTFTVTLSLANAQPVSVSHATADGTAKAPSDYTAIPTTTLTFAAGETSKQVTVLVKGDKAVEGNETFFVNLSNAKGAAITDNQAVGTIQNDDAQPTPTATATPTPKATATATPTATPKPTATPRATPKSTATPSATPKASATATPKSTPTPTATPKPTATATASPKSTPTATPKPTATPTGTPQSTATPTATPKATATPMATPKSTATPTATPKATATPTATPKSTATATATPKSTATPTATPKATATPTATPTAAPGLVGNVSTRLPVGSGDNALIEGFIVQGPPASIKKILVRAVGPSLIPFGIPDALANPTLEIFAGTTKVASNDDWKRTQVGGIITSNQFAEINGSGLAPSNDLESAIVANLTPGSYSAVVRGAGNSVGTGVVDAFDISAGATARLANIATRGLIQPGDQLMIAGFIVQGNPIRAVIRAVGPSLAAFGITNALPDTTLQLRDQNGVIVGENDDWQSDPTQKAELEAIGLQPTDPLEAALIQTIQPGQYTAQVRGKPETTGTGVVQVYFLQ